MKPLADYMVEKAVGIPELVAATGLDARLVKAIVEGNYTPSPAQRQKLAGALCLSTGEISWDHSISVQHLRGNGPQSGRST
jgi:hypothetical protein